MSHLCCNGSFLSFFSNYSRLTLNGQFVTIPRVLSIEQRRGHSRTAFNTVQRVEKEKTAQKH